MNTNYGRELQTRITDTGVQYRTRHLMLPMQQKAATRQRQRRVGCKNRIHLRYGWNRTWWFLAPFSSQSKRKTTLFGA